MWRVGFAGAVHAFVAPELLCLQPRHKEAVDECTEGRTASQPLGACLSRNETLRLFGQAVEAEAHVRRQLESFSTMLAEYSRVPLEDHPCIELRVVVHLESSGIWLILISYR